MRKRLVLRETKKRQGVRVSKEQLEQDVRLDCEMFSVFLLARHHLSS